MVDLFGGRVNKDQNIIVLILFGVCCFIFGHFFSGLVQNNAIIVDEWKDIVIFIGSLCLNIGDTILQLLKACIIPLIIICILYAVVWLDTRTAENVVRYSAIYYLGMILITVGITLALREKLGWNGIAKEEKYGTIKSPGKSCSDILQKRSEGCFPDDIYWISIEPNRNRENAFPVFCDMKSGGFTMAFKVVSGGNRLTSIGKFWKQKLPSHESSLGALNKFKSFTGLYKNRLVDPTNWNKVVSSEVRFVLYKNGLEQLVLKFKCPNCSYIDWFTQLNLVESPWHDITSSTFNYFTIEGRCFRDRCRDFHINHNYDYCPKDDGWLSIGNTIECPWEKRFSGTSFIYSIVGRHQNYNEYNSFSGDSDVLAIFVR
ncbi:uncharacterized protein LOC124440721 [Xenia sp. Carnegie-2017]|uniref:uncharacterized protein LOC124440721 n=1 Tax=Xenia sp. Carnegie-2017 TaxID=2897299 RepID=UPI001F04970C|nr:uncharacterized protein LOC124440721 [Xenia sp. Carnegie-2017]